MFGKKSKKEKLMELLEEIGELYPDLNRVICLDLDDPDSIIICSDKRAREVANDMGLDYMLDDVADVINGDDDDEGNGGVLH